MISKNKITLALILSSFLGVSISFSDLYLFHIFLIISFLVWLYEFKKNKYLFNYSFFLRKYVKTLIFILLWYFLSILWAPDKVLGLKYLFYLICGFITTASIILFSSNIKNLNIVYKLLSMIVFIEIVINGLKKRKKWTWFASLILCGIYIPSAFIILGIVGLIPLIDKNHSRES